MPAAQRPRRGVKGHGSGHVTFRGAAGRVRGGVSKLPRRTEVRLVLLRATGFASMS